MNLLLIPLPPLISFVLLILFGRRLGRWSPVVSLLALGGSLVFSVQALLQLLTLHPSPFTLHPTWTWLSLGERSIPMGLQMDPLSAVMCLVVTGIGWLIMLYSIGYMGKDPRFSRFFAYLSLFFCAMLTLVLADNLILLYIGWEGVGLCSYLLISFWFERPAAANAGKKAFLTTRVGDLGLLIGILLTAWRTGDAGFANWESKAAALGAWAPAAALLIFWGAAGKSAQFPLHVWLPDAMEGPTPVSALIHAATMVAAGVYLVARTLPLFLPSPDAMLAVATIGGITSFFAATIACTQTDLKRILAYSTISQLGFMVMALGAGSAEAGIFHLMTHAWFKALLFLGAGSVIHAVHHQEVTRMGGLWKPMPITTLTFTVAAAAMAGIPPLSGFWSKEEVLISLAGLSHPKFPQAGLFFLGVGLATAFLTAFYISRAVVLTFFRKPHVIPALGPPFRGDGRGQAPAGNPRVHEDPRFREDGIHHPHESPLVMTGPLMILMVGAAGAGLLGSPLGGNAFQHFLGPVPGALLVPGTDDWIQPAAIGLALAGIALAVLRYQFGFRVSLPPLQPLYRLAANKYYIDELYDRWIIRPVLAISRRSFSFDAGVIDGTVNGAGTAGLSLSALKGWIDAVIVDGAVNGMAMGVGWAGGALRLLQTGLVQNYLLIAAASTVTLVLLWRIF